MKQSNKLFTNMGVAMNSVRMLLKPTPKDDKAAILAAEEKRARKAAKNKSTGLTHRGYN